MSYSDALASIKEQLEPLIHPQLSELPTIKLAHQRHPVKRKASPIPRERHSEIYMPESGTYECTCGHSACCELFQSRRDDEDFLP